MNEKKKICRQQKTQKVHDLVHDLKAGDRVVCEQI